MKAVVMAAIIVCLSALIVIAMQRELSNVVDTFECPSHELEAGEICDNIKLQITVISYALFIAIPLIGIMAYNIGRNLWDEDISRDEPWQEEIASVINPHPDINKKIKTLSNPISIRLKPFIEWMMKPVGKKKNDI